jgi:hypothetical protein
MAPERPKWRATVDRVDQRISPVADQVVRTDAFADAMGVLSRLRHVAQQRVERSLRNQWHFWNVPAGSDVKRLSQQLASLENRVRDLGRQLEEERREATDAPVDGPVPIERARRPAPARRRKVGPPGP